MDRNEAEQKKVCRFQFPYSKWKWFCLIFGSLVLSKISSDRAHSRWMNSTTSSIQSPYSLAYNYTQWENSSIEVEGCVHRLTSLNINDRTNISTRGAAAYSNKNHVKIFIYIYYVTDWDNNQFWVDNWTRYIVASQHHRIFFFRN